MGSSPLAIELAWAAGFFDGEGCTSVKISHRRTYAYRYVKVNVVQTTRPPLLRFARAVGGTVTGPFGPYSGNRQPHWQVNATGVRAHAILKKLWPYLSSPKRLQARKVMAFCG